MGFLALLVIGAVLAVPASASAQKPASAQDLGEAGRAPLRIVAFGDSLTSGHRLSGDEAYPAVLEASLKAAGIAATVINHGRNGDTTAGGIRRLDDALAEQPDILIVAFGANDGLRGVPVSQVRANLERIIERAQARGAAVLLVGMEALPLHGWQYTIDFHHLFPAVAAKSNVPLVPFMLNGVFGNPDLMGRDGVHPNAAGARMIAANILPELRALAEKLVTAAD